MMPAVPATGGGRHGRLLGIPHRRLRHRIQFGLPERSQKQAYICGCEGTDSRGASERRTDAREAKRIKRGGRDGRTGGDPAQRCTDTTDRANGLIYRSMHRSHICTGTGLPPLRHRDARCTCKRSDRSPVQMYTRICALCQPVGPDRTATKASVRRRLGDAFREGAGRVTPAGPGAVKSAVYVPRRLGYLPT